jgi:hypothetical protein
MAANIADLNKVWDIRVLKKERAEEARKMLEQVAKQVQPIMRKRKWKVRMLSEFRCASSCLLINLLDDLCPFFCTPVSFLNEKLVVFGLYSL